MLRSKIKITERDEEILEFINEFGFCDITQLEKRFVMKKPRCYQVMQRLVKEGLIIHQRIFHGRPGLFKLSSKGAKFTDLPPLVNVPLNHYRHQLLAIEVSLRCRQLYPEAVWISERQLQKEKFYDGIGKRGHLADGLLVFPDGQKIAIEIELTKKAASRRLRILKYYGAQFSINEVWYYCDKRLLNALRSATEKMPFIKIHDIQEFLA